MSRNCRRMHEAFAPTFPTHTETVADCRAHSANSPLPPTHTHTHTHHTHTHAPLAVHESGRLAFLSPNARTSAVVPPQVLARTTPSVSQAPRYCISNHSGPFSPARSTMLPSPPADVRRHHGRPGGRSAVEQAASASHHLWCGQHCQREHSICSHSQLAYEAHRLFDAPLTINTAPGCIPSCPQ
jgi:hypothetical protein